MDRHRVGRIHTRNICYPQPKGHQATIDERLEKLTERHEALAQTLELESLNIAATRALVDKTVVLVNLMIEGINGLTGIVKSHEERISGLETS
jgi:hypothetical protein